MLGIAGIAAAVAAHSTGVIETPIDATSRELRSAVEEFRRRARFGPREEREDCSEIAKLGDELLRFRRHWAVISEVKEDGPEKAERLRSLSARIDEFSSLMRVANQRLDAARQRRRAASEAALEAAERKRARRRERNQGRPGAG